MADWVWLSALGALAGAMNAMAGGGSFLTLPVLIGVGIPSVMANATSAVALYPGGAASAWVYRAGFDHVFGFPVRAILIATLTGGLVGAALLLETPTTLFDRVLPWLLLIATLALAFGSRLGPALRSRFRAGLMTVFLVQFVLGIYGGYFGGAVGLMMMAAWSLLYGMDMKAMNPPKTLLVTVANTVAVLCFVLAGAVRWHEAVLVGAGALLGGFVGAWMGKRLSPVVVKVATVVIAAGMTAHFFLRAY